MNDQNYIPLSAELMQLITSEQAWHYSIVPKAKDNGTIVFYTANDRDPAVAEELEIIFGGNIKLIPEDPERIRQTLGRYYRQTAESSTEKIAVSSDESEDFLIRLIREAKQLNSSDIHIERYEEKCRVRIRIDGQLNERYVLDKASYPGLINKIKIKANLDIAEKRLPQDGRIFFHSGEEKFDIRVSVLPALYGEKAVMRLLSTSATDIDINTLGFSDHDLTGYLEGVKKPNGIILISGPTGSGKTTTLYATLRLLNKESRNIMTIEDPIEYTLEGINQVQLKESIGLTFASALRTFLRQDPDVIMVGEIRDKETASMAIRAALTGHLVLSTIHTNSAWGTVSRLIDMGVQPYLLASTLNTSVAQRLVRLLCTACARKEAFDPSLFPAGFRPFEKVSAHFVPVGCEKCYYTGYKGRVAIYEVITIDPEVSSAIKHEKFQIEEILKERKVKKLSENAFGLFAGGLTSLEEVYPLLITNY